jgi:hypothetical protein
MNENYYQILLIITVILFGLDLFSDFLEISFLEGKYKWLMVAYFSLMLIIDGIQFYQRKKGNGSA